MVDVPEQPDSSPPAPAVPPSALFDFHAAEQIAAWRPLNDTVMGGRSSSRMESIGDGRAAFRGTTSLENRGGFASVRAPLEPGALAGAAGIELRVRGDGRTYRLLVAEDRGTGRGSYDAEVETFAGVWGTVRIPFDDMRLNIRGRRPNAAPPLVEKIRSIGLLIGDKRSGDFALEVEWIRPYR